MSTHRGKVVDAQSLVNTTAPLIWNGEAATLRAKRNLAPTESNGLAG